MSENIIPFGKYRGKELEEIIVSDPQYIEWLKKQHWLNDTIKQQIININTVVNQKSDSPEHNLLQVKIFNLIDDKFMNMLRNRKIYPEHWQSYSYELKNKELEKKIRKNYIDIYCECETENKYNCWSTFFIFEIKPYFNDDFMQYIRQIETYKSELDKSELELKVFLIYEFFNVTNISKEDIEKIFLNKNIILLSLKEILYIIEQVKILKKEIITYLSEEENSDKHKLLTHFKDKSYLECEIHDEIDILKKEKKIIEYNSKLLLC